MSLISLPFFLIVVFFVLRSSSYQKISPLHPQKLRRSLRIDIADFLVCERRQSTPLGVSLSAESFSRPSSRSSNRQPSQKKPSTNEQESIGQIDLLFDSKCPICMMEVEFLKKRDINNKIRFTDLQSSDYNPEEHGNVKFSEGMRKIRAVLPNKTVVVGVEVFRQTYEAIGLGWVFSMTKFPVIGYLADRLYDLWAENRLRLTGREECADELKERSEALRKLEFDENCTSDACGIDYDNL